MFAPMVDRGAVLGVIHVAADDRPSFNVAEGINPQVVNIAVARMEGVTTAVSEPTGSLIPG